MSLVSNVIAEPILLSRRRKDMLIEFVTTRS
jgi:hypothetical protein